MVFLEGKPRSTLGLRSCSANVLQRSRDPILVEDGLRAIASLGRTVRETRDNHAGKAHYADKTIFSIRCYLI